MKRALRLFACVLLAFLAAGPGCSKNEPAGPGAAKSAEPLGPVPAPDGLIAELFMPAPDATWRRSRSVIGGPAAFFPQSFGGLVATLLGLPITVAGDIDGNVPVVGAIAVKEGDSKLRGAIGIHVRVGDRMLDQLTKGEGARFVATPDPATHIVSLSSSTGAKLPVVLGLLGNHLLVAFNDEDMKAFAPYVVRTLAKKPAPKEDLVLEIDDRALAGPIAKRTRDRWSQVKASADAAGTPVLFADKIEKLFGVLGDLKGARLAVEIVAEGVRGRLALTPKAAQGPAATALAEMTVGDAKPLLDLPASSLIALLYRESAASRAASVATQAQALAKLITKDPAPEDNEAIAAALKAQSEASGDWVALGLTLSPTGPSGFARMAVSNDDQMAKALKDITELAKRKAIKDRFKDFDVDIGPGKTAVERLPGDVLRVRFKKGGDKDAKGEKKSTANAKAAAGNESLPDHTDLLCLVEKEVAYAAVGYESKEALRTVVTAKDAESLGGNEKLKLALERLGADASFTLTADPNRLIAARSGKPLPADASPVVVALGRSQSPAEIWVRFDFATTAVQAFIRSRGKLGVP
jgi:hypothetical protein